MAQLHRACRPAARLLAALASQEVTDRERRRFERHRAEAKLPPGKTLDNFDFTLVPAVSKARVGVLASGDTWLDEGANVLLFGPTDPVTYCTTFLCACGIDS